MEGGGKASSAGDSQDSKGFEEQSINRLEIALIAEEAGLPPLPSMAGPGAALFRKADWNIIRQVNPGFPCDRKRRICLHGRSTGHEGDNCDGIMAAEAQEIMDLQEILAAQKA